MYENWRYYQSKKRRTWYDPMEEFDQLHDEFIEVSVALEQIEKIIDNVNNQS